MTIPVDSKWEEMNRNAPAYPNLLKSGTVPRAGPLTEPASL